MSDNYDDISTVRENNTFVIDTDKEYKSHAKEDDIGGYHPSYNESDEKDMSPLRKHMGVVIGLTAVMIWYMVLTVLQSTGVVNGFGGLLLGLPPIIIGLIAFAYLKNRQLR